MAKITRKTASIFGSSAGTNQIAKFGSLAAGSPAFSTDPAVIQSLAEWTEGWFNAIEGSNSPAIEDMNAFCYVMAYQVAYLLQQGIAEWDSATTYYTGQFVASNSTIYVSLVDNNLNNAVTNGSYWSAFSGGGGSGSPEALVEVVSDNQHYGVFTDPIDASVETGFVQQPGNYTINGILIAPYTSGGTSMAMVWAPLYLNASDKNTSTTSNWSTENAATSLTTSATTQIGATSVSFNKTTSATNAQIKYDYGSASFAIASNTNLWFWINLPSLTNLQNVTMVIDIDGTNYETYTATTNYAGSALVVGWNLMYFNLANAGTGSGTGWNSSQSFRYFHVGVNASSASQTYTGILINAVFFEIVSPSNFIQPGQRVTIYNNSTSDVMMIDASNTTVDGGAVILTTSLSNNYSGGFGTSSAVVTRSGLSIGLGQAAMTTIDQFGNTLAGAARLTQAARISTVLRDALSSNKLTAFADLSTQQVYPAVSVTGSTIVVTDTVNQSADLLNGETMHVFRAIYADGKKYFIWRGNMTLTSNSSNTGGQTTLNGTPPAGTSIGDYIVKDQLALSYSCVNIGSNENFQTMSPLAVPDGVLMYDNGLPIPNISTAYGLFTLSYINPYVNQRGSMPNFTQSGTLTNISTFKQGMTATSGWTSSNYLTSVGSNSTINNASSFSISFWHYTLGRGSSQGAIMGTETGTATGFSITLNASNQLSFGVNSLSGGISTTISTGTWNHIVVNYQAGSTCQIYLNGILVASGTPGIINPSGAVDLTVGTDTYIGPITSTDLIAQILINIGSNLSASQVLQIYNNGLSQILGFGPRLKYRATAININGQKLSLESTLSRDTVNVIPSMTKMGIIQTG